MPKSHHSTRRDGDETPSPLGCLVGLHQHAELPHRRLVFCQGRALMQSAKFAIVGEIGSYDVDDLLGLGHHSCHCIWASLQVEEVVSLAL